MLLPLLDMLFSTTLFTFLLNHLQIHAQVHVFQDTSPPLHDLTGPSVMNPYGTPLIKETFTYRGLGKSFWLIKQALYICFNY